MYLFAFAIHRITRATISVRSLPMVCSVLLLSGCQIGTSYRAAELPQELAARPVIDVQSLELSRFGPQRTDTGLIYPEDILLVAVSAGDEESIPPLKPLRVARNGMVNVPLIGPVSVSSLTLSDAADSIRMAGIQRQIYVSPTAFVVFKERKVHRITVAGAVNHPGTYELKAGASHLTAALLAAGGLSQKAAATIEIHNPSYVGLTQFDTPRPVQAGSHSSNQQSVESAAYSTASTRPHVIRISLLDHYADNPTADRNLSDGTVITVRKQPERYVTVIGLTGNKTLQMPYDREYRVLDALVDAGGTRYSVWISNKLTVFRRHPETGETVAIKVSINGAKHGVNENLVLSPGDVLSVEETPITFAIGTIAQLIGAGQSAIIGAVALP